MLAHVCRVKALLTSSVMNLCGIYYTQPLIWVSTNSKLKPDNPNPSLLSYAPVNFECYEFVYSLLYTSFDLCKYKLKTDSQPKPDNDNPLYVEVWPC